MRCVSIARLLMSAETLSALSVSVVCHVAHCVFSVRDVLQL